MNLFPDFVAGDNVEQAFAFKDANGEALDVTGYELYLTVKQTYAVTDANAALANIYQPTGSAWTLALSSAETAAIAPGTYALEIRMKDPAGNVATLLEQPLRVKQPLRETLA